MQFQLKMLKIIHLLNTAHNKYVKMEQMRKNGTIAQKWNKCAKMGKQVFTQEDQLRQKRNVGIKFKY